MQETQTFSLPRPGKALIATMVTVTAVWVLFAVGINWGGGGEALFLRLVGSNDILHGEVWRLVTAWIVHQPTGAGSSGHLLTTLLGLYFLGATLEQRWGARRFVLFMVGSGVLAALLQVLLGKLIPPLHSPQFFGALGVIDAIAVAWALSFKGQQVRLFFVLPVSGTGLILFVLAVNVLYVLSMEARREGLVTPFGGMLAGYLFAEGSPVRRKYLEWKLARLGQQKVKLASMSKAASHLSVIEGGRSSKKPDKSLLN